MKYYYGAWQNFYHLSWPIRFFFELLVFLFLLMVVIKSLMIIVSKSGLRIYMITGIVWIVKEIVYFLGRTRSWAIDADSRIIDWGEKRISDEDRKIFVRLKVYVCLGIASIYLLAVFVDLPVSQNLEDYYLQELEKIKIFFQQGEHCLSLGYENYPPLFIEAEVKETMTDNNLEEEPVIEEVVTYLKLNEKGQNGSNIRETPSLDGLVVGGVRENPDIIYQNQWEYDGERYWLKIYLPEEEMYGWISGKLIDSEQLEEIISLSEIY